MTRPSLFEETDLGLDRFAPKTDPSLQIPAEIVRKTAEAGGFPNRAPQSKREPLTYRTGRNAAFSVKTTPQTVEAFYAIARAQGWKAGETFEKAIEALQHVLTGHRQP